MSRPTVRAGRDKAFTPDPRKRYGATPLLDPEGSAGTAWNDSGRIAATHPACTEPKCGRSAMTWSRCVCGASFALCGDHAVGDRSTARERAAHNESCAPMQARFAAR